ncbi:MAG: class I SAM-dependent methyltransferase [bacterium]
MPALSLGPFVDVGCGENGVTTSESLDGLRAAGFSGPVWAVETVPSRLPNHEDITCSSELPPTAGVVRAMNVLRQYHPSDCEAALKQWAAVLCDGGHLLEGTTDKHGHIACFFDLGSVPYLVFATTFEKGFGPWMFRDYLPQLWRRSVLPGTDLFAFFELWHSHYVISREVCSLSERFRRSSQSLADARLGAEVSKLPSGMCFRVPLNWSADRSLALSLSPETI